jgi:hypothetical protein
MVINGTNPGLWSVFHIEALWRGNILASYVHFLDADATQSWTIDFSLEKFDGPIFIIKSTLESAFEGMKKGELHSLGFRQKRLSVPRDNYCLYYIYAA